MSSGEWKIQVISAVSNFLNRRNVFCGLTLVVLNAIAWPSFVVWIVIDIGLAFLLILPWILQLTKKKSTRVDIMFPGNVKDLQGGFGSAMSEAFDSHLRNSEDSRVRSSSRRTRYNHEFSRCTPDERDNRTPFPRMSAIKNRLSYSTAEASIRSATPTSFSPSSKNTLQERSRTLHNPPRPAHHNYTPSDTVSSSVLHIARSNLPVAREVRSPVVVKVAPLGTSPRISLVEAKHEDETSRRDDVVNALKQITQKRKRVYPLSDNKDDENSFLDSLPSVKKSRQEPAAQQALKRTWTKTITNESFSKAPMPETKKHKTSSNVTKEPPSLVRESMVIPPPAKMSRVEENQKAKDMEEAKSSTPLIEEEVTQILNTSDKENESLDKTKLSTEQKDKAPSVVIKKLRTVYPSSKPSLDARRRKYPILCSSGVAPKLVRNQYG